jgi:hypothetical protein
MTRWDALVDACHKRARPIIMTTIAMGAGMLPIAIGWGSGRPELSLSPMAVAVIGGLITSTVLSLLVVPVVFTYLDDIEHFIKRMAGSGAKGCGAADKDRAISFPRQKFASKSCAVGASNARIQHCRIGTSAVVE